MSNFDPRIYPYRPEIASSDLEGKVIAKKFVDGKILRVSSQSSLLWAQPNKDQPITSELLFGENVAVFESISEDWSWVQNQTDCYVGWIKSNSLCEANSEITHTVSALRTYLFPKPEHKLVPIGIISYGSRLSVVNEHVERGTKYAILADGSAVIQKHIRPIEEYSSDFVAEAEKFIGAPYLWGGRTSIGLDCSALVQLTLNRIGVDCPRDSDLQENVIGEGLDISTGLPELQRGDLIFWNGHVAIMLDSMKLIHANAYTMSVEIELAELVIDRIMTQSSAGVTSVRRLSI